MAPDEVTDGPRGCRVLDWDSAFFGRRIARIDARALVANAEEVSGWCQRSGVECACLLVDAADEAGIVAAHEQQFRLVDLRLTLVRPLPPPAAASSSRHDVHIRPVVPSDLDALRAIARISHRDTRFYVDAHFDRTRCDDLYDLWITKSCQGWADAVFVADIGGTVAGYVTCHRRADGGEIGLVGVDPSVRRVGAAVAMTDAALRWFESVGFGQVRVVTQGRNAPALGLYQKAGFAVQSIEFSYHKWA